MELTRYVSDATGRDCRERFVARDCRAVTHVVVAYVISTCNVGLLLLLAIGVCCVYNDALQVVFAIAIVLSILELATCYAYSQECRTMLHLKLCCAILYAHKVVA